MDKKTRVLNALNSLPVDRVPVGFWFHFSGEEAVGEGCVKAHLDYHKQCNTDFIKIMCDNYFPYPISIDQSNAASWLQLRPMGKDHPFIKEQVERARRIREEVGDDCCLFYNVFAPFSSIRFGTSDELVMQHIKENPAAIMHALDVIARDNATLAELLVTQGGCDGIYYAVQGGEYGRFSCEDYRRMIAPSDLAVLNHANKFSTNNIMHLCGWAGVKNQIELWKDYPAKMINWAVYVEELALEDGFAYFGNKSIMGGFQSTKDGIFYQGSKDEVKAFTKTLLKKTGTRGVILGGDCTIPADVDRNRIGWVMEAVAEYMA